MSEKIDEEELHECMMKQNSDVCHEYLKFELLFTRKAKNDTHTIIFSTDPITHKSVMSARKVRINLDIAYVYDHIYILQCFNCQGFHHISEKCYGSSRFTKCSDSPCTL